MTTSVLLVSTANLGQLATSSTPHLTTRTTHIPLTREDRSLIVASLARGTYSKAGEGSSSVICRVMIDRSKAFIVKIPKYSGLKCVANEFRVLEYLKDGAYQGYGIIQSYGILGSTYLEPMTFNGLVLESLHESLDVAKWHLSNTVGALFFIKRLANQLVSTLAFIHSRDIIHSGLIY